MLRPPAPASRAPAPPFTLEDVERERVARQRVYARGLLASITRRDAEIDATTPKIERRGFRQTRPQSRSGRVAPR